MPDTQLLPITSVQWDREVIYPHPQLTGGTASPLPQGLSAPDHMGLERGSILQGTIDHDPLNLTTTSAGGGFGQINIPGGGATTFGPCLQTGANGLNARFATGFPGLGCILTTRATGLPLGMSFPSSRRVYWARVLISNDVGFPLDQANQTGVIWSPSNEPRGQASWPTQPVGPNNTGGFGFVSDGAGQWSFRSFDRTGAPTIRFAVPVPAHDPLQPNMAEILIYNSRPGVEATVEAYFNGTQLGSWDWTGANLENLVGSEWMLVPQVNAQDVGGISNQLINSQWWVRWGRFTPLGIEIQG